MKITIIGAGHVGLVAGACFAETGQQVRCVDIDEDRIDSLNCGELPIHEPEIERIFRWNTDGKKINFSKDIGKAVDWADLVMIAVGTSGTNDGTSDLSMVLNAAETIASNLNGFTIVACKSTMPIGGSEKIREVISSRTEQPFVFVYNPEFMRRGSAVNDFLKPSRVVVGTDSKRAREVMFDLYTPLFGYNDAKKKIQFMSLRSAEMTKYMVNAYLSARIAFVNEMANLCEAVDANIEEVILGAGTDPRIGLTYLEPGCGYGGSSFHTDLLTMLQTAERHEQRLEMIEAIDRSNVRQKLVPIDKLKKHLGTALTNKRIAIWGLAFKPETDDVRGSPSDLVVRSLLSAGAEVRVHDPVACANFEKNVTDEAFVVDDMYDALDDADALIILTNWQVYREADLDKVAARLAGNVVIDGRNIWFKKDRPTRWKYEGIGIKNE
ncbi:MAG: UDP-glucose/GDP-mannose dehydrogenase family protein [Proteobacteria bacterium]|nr:UDP-glucose/GDP-mannose dehydrogenase family protein [Pseudomonadota bacterium]